MKAFCERLERSMVTGLRGQPVREHCYRDRPGLMVGWADGPLMSDH